MVFSEQNCGWAAWLVIVPDEQVGHPFRFSSSQPELHLTVVAISAQIHCPRWRCQGKCIVWRYGCKRGRAEAWLALKNL